MHILIVEDSDFNAFCLKRLLESVYPTVVRIKTVNNSLDALHACETDVFDAIIIDGDLGAGDGLCCNGAALADAILTKYPQYPIISWTDSDHWRSAFADVFRQHHKHLNETNCWPKVVTYERIRKSLALSKSTTTANRSKTIESFSDTASS